MLLKKKIEGKGRRLTRPKQLLDYRKEITGYWKFKEETVDCAG
jgi:hypothetical protein